MPGRSLIPACLPLMLLAACQSTSTQPSTVSEAKAATLAETKIEANAYAATPASIPARCAITLAGGPPPKPAKGADFGSAAVKNVSKNVSRNLISGIAGQVAGPLGGAVAGGLAMDAIRPEQDLKGQWTATDGSDSCGCTLDISSGINLQGKSSDKGKLAPKGCGNPLLASAARWSLGYSFTGYDAPFSLTDSRGRTIASMKRNGMDHFSGSLVDGTPITIWRK